MYTSALGLDADAAEGLFDQLVHDKIIATPDPSGIASAVSPFFKSSGALYSVAEAHPLRIKPETTRPSISLNKSQDALSKLEKTEERLHPETEGCDDPDAPQDDFG